jgi:hypothetical protein
MSELCNEGKLTVERYVDSYHIDDQIGLNEFVSAITPKEKLFCLIWDVKRQEYSHVKSPWSDEDLQSIGFEVKERYETESEVIDAFTRKKNNLVDLELAKRLKSEGYTKPTEFYWQDKDLSFVKSGLKCTKNGEKMNHNKYDDFIYSAPTILEAVEWLHGKNMKYESSIVIELGRK